MDFAMLALIALVAIGFAYCAGRNSRNRTAPTYPQRPNSKPPAASSSLREHLASKRQEIINQLLRDFKSLFTNTSVVSTYMTTELETTAPDTPLHQVGDLLRKRGVRHLLVCDEKRRIVGVISDRDLRARTGAVAADIMTPEPDTISAETSMIEAVEIMITGNFSSLPVCDGDEVVGLITTTDVILALQCTFGVLREVANRLQKPQLVA